MDLAMLLFSKLKHLFRSCSFLLEMVVGFFCLNTSSMSSMGLYLIISHIINNVPLSTYISLVFYLNSAGFCNSGGKRKFE
jgi:hypothetical protein